MSTNFKRRDKHSTQCDAIRGQQAMNRLTGVVKYEQRVQAKSESFSATFNSQPQAGWKKDWKSTMAGKGKAKGDASIGPDASWTDEQSWLQGSRKCFDSRRSVSATKEAGYPSTASSSTVPEDCVKAGRTASAGESGGALPSLPVLPKVLPKEVSRKAFRAYIAEVNSVIQQSLCNPGNQADAEDLLRFTAELAQALRALTKPASVSQKTQICEAMAPVWDMRSNSAPPAGAPSDLRALAGVLDTLGNCFCSEETMPVSASAAKDT